VTERRNIAQSNALRAWRKKREQRQQMQLPVDPCPHCTAAEKKDCSYEQSLRRLGLSALRPRPKGCLAGGPGELPPDF
jgi:hypothetical protein